MYLKSLELRKAIFEETGTVESGRGLSVSYEKLGEIYQAEGRLTEAKEMYLKDLELSEAIFEETGTVVSYDDLAVSYYKLARTFNDKQYYQKAYEIWAHLSNECPNVAEYKRRRNIVAFILSDR